MPTVFTHPAVALGLLPWFRDVRNSKAIVITGIILTIMPDIDVVAFRFDIPYTHMFGHRGFSHSLFFAALVSGLCAWLLAKYCVKKIVPVWLFLFLCMASHGILDAFTNGGHGIALLSPFSNERYFSSFQPIEVSTLNIKRFFEGQGIDVIKSELQWIWLPLIIIFLIGVFCLKRSNKS